MTQMAPLDPLAPFTRTTALFFFLFALITCHRSSPFVRYFILHPWLPAHLSLFILILSLFAYCCFCSFPFPRASFSIPQYWSLAFCVSFSLPLSLSLSFLFLFFLRDALLFTRRNGDEARSLLPAAFALLKSPRFFSLFIIFHFPKHEMHIMSGNRPYNVSYL